MPADVDPAGNASGVGQFNLLLFGPPAGGKMVFDDLSWVGGPDVDPPVTGNYTGIQITGSTSNIMTNVQVGDTVMFTVNAIANASAGTINYRFFTRAGYGITDPAWGGNTWQLVQDFSAMNSVSVLFDTAGTYFLAGHAERAGEAWAFGDPQTGIVVEVYANVRK